MPTPHGDGGKSTSSKCIFCAEEFGSDIVFDAIVKLVDVALNDIPSFLPDEWMVRAIQLRTEKIDFFLHHQ